ncbi:Ankyrin repeat-containing protein isoform B [Glycine soja]|uniref:Ankyrin repeat-containing protein isoform B n=1 Tax=Glycine soja TaxID=3848 RepID=A0A445IX50_GLYSO|nr:Ankyrin repeat-containing protein isoform B [Glycine soja]
MSAHNHRTTIACDSHPHTTHHRHHRRTHGLRDLKEKLRMEKARDGLFEGLRDVTKSIKWRRKSCRQMFYLQVRAPLTLSSLGSTVVNLMDNIITEGHSISRPPYFNGRNYTEWKERMKIFIQSVDFKLWLLIKNGPKVPTKLVDNEEVEKTEDEYDEEDMKNLELEAKAKNILHCALNPDVFEIFSEGPNTSKQMWDELDRVFDRERTGDNSSTPQGQLSSDPTAPDTSQFSSPDLYFLQETRESMNKFLELCVPLHKLALEGNWQAAKVILGKDSRLKHAAIADGWATLLHVAVGANHASFVKELLQEFDNDQYISLQDYRGNTAFCFAVASGNMEIVELLKGRDPHLPTRRGGSDYIPIQFAAMQGNCDMTRYLYDISKEAFEDTDKIMLFFTFIKTGNYHEWVELAYARDDNNETALHLLAVNQNPLDSCCHCPEMEGSFRINPDTKHVMFQLVNFLWKKILQHKDHSEAMRIISEPSQLLYDAAEVGNFGFLSELISAYPGKIIWEVDNNGQSIIHTAVSYRHASIFNLVHEIGFIKDILISYIVKENNTLLHLAAKLAPPDRLAIVSGAAFQMCLEIIWFEEVKKIMPPSFINLKNSDGLTAQQLFIKEHEGLRGKGEEWMKRTAEFCMLISTVIATAIFAAAINIPGGIDDDTKKPNYLNKASFQVFAIADAAAFIFSATAILIFLSILISRYAVYDFHKSLPLKLIFGLITLFISIACMMVAFGSSFFITYYYGLKVLPDSIAVLSCLPLLLYVEITIFSSERDFGSFSRENNTLRASLTTEELEDHN